MGCSFCYRLREVRLLEAFCDLSVVLCCRAEIKPHYLKAAAAFLHACKKAAADFEKCGFISLSSTQNNREATKNEAVLSQKAAIGARLHCTRTTKLSKNTALFASSLPAGTCARAVKGNENKRLLFLPSTPGWNQSAFSVLSPARAQ